MEVPRLRRLFGSMGREIRLRCKGPLKRWVTRDGRQKALIAQLEFAITFC